MLVGLHPVFLAAQKQFQGRKKCVGRESNPGLARGRGLYYHCTTDAQSIRTQDRTGDLSRVRRASQPTRPYEHDGVSGFRSQYLVLAKDARFRLRQYPNNFRNRLFHISYSFPFVYKRVVWCKKKQKNDWSGIRTHASEETSALNWRLRPLGHPTGRFVAGARCVPFHRRAL